jgi:hypothetical protein
MLLIASLSVLIDLKLRSHILIIQLHMLDVMRLPRGEPGEHVALRLQILQFAVQLTNVYIVVGCLVGLHSVLQELDFVSLLNCFLLQTLVVLSKSGNFLAK